jgi:hypothetical protein
MLLVAKTQLNNERALIIKKEKKSKIKEKDEQI